tara:strand:- start:16928 stop:17665 length:738 start_codon:yes stop_codon:yes gene_type:complete
MKKYNIINFARLKASPLFTLSKKNIYPTSDIFLWHKNLEVDYMLLNNNFIFKEKNDTYIKLFLLDRLGNIISENNIEPKNGIFTVINVSKFLNGIKDSYGGFSIFQYLKNKKFGRAERGYVYYKNYLLKRSSLVHGNLDAVYLKDGKIYPCSSTTFISRKFFVQNVCKNTSLIKYYFANPTKKNQIVHILDEKMKKIDKFLLNPLGGSIRGPYDSEMIIVKSRMPLCRPVIINDLKGINLDIYHA